MLTNYLQRGIVKLEEAKASPAPVQAVAAPAIEAAAHFSAGPTQASRVQKIKTEGDRRAEELNNLKPTSAFSRLKIVDHILFLRPHETRASVIHKYDTILAKFLSRKESFLELIICSDWPAHEKLFAASVYARATGETFPYSDIKNSLTSGNKEVNLELTMEDFPLVMWRSEQEDPNKELHEGILTRDFTKVRKAIYQGARLDTIDPNFGWTPLHWAVASGEVSIVYFLLQNGANPNAKKILPKECSLENLTPFELALNHDYDRIPLMMISAGAVITKKQIESTPISKLKSTMEESYTKRHLPNKIDPAVLPEGITLKEIEKKRKTYTKKLHKVIDEILKIFTSTKIRGSESLAKLLPEGAFLPEVLTTYNKATIMEKTTHSVRSVMSEKNRDYPEIVQQFYRDSIGNDYIVKLPKNRKILAKGNFEPGKNLIDHDSAFDSFGVKATAFAEAVLQQGTLADALQACEMAASIELGRNSPLSSNNGTDTHFDLQRDSTLELERKDSQYVLTARNNYDLVLKKEDQTSPTSYIERFATIEQTYTFDENFECIDFNVIKS